MDVPKEVSAACSVASCPDKLLNRAWPRHWNSTRSPIRDLGEMPKLRASAKRNSARADGTAAASSLHHVGQAASIAALLNPAARSPRRSWSVLRVAISGAEAAVDGSRVTGELILARMTGGTEASGEILA
jgi:hypothetical protein